ncbi:MAG: PQQ-binding-like beta-propeller repeat protein [Chloroflexales bacterium]|nr:PQQ-binding-like beta-propeller repeat protein [Chloroflexales bacterium]
MADGQPFGPRVRERRRALDLTQEELARQVGCASVTLRKIEGSHLRASRQIAERLAIALDIPLAERDAFVRAARVAVVERGESREPAPSPTPLLTPEELGSDDLSGRVVRSYQDSDNPYKGLQAFDEADVENFFGRETLLHQLLSRLGEGGELARFLALIGPSGSGKSSLVRAGLIPALRSGGLPASERWYLVMLTPGAQPLDELARQLHSVAPLAVETDDLRTLLGADERGLLCAARLVLPADPQVELLLVIDQFEELFTLCGDVGERAQVLRSLVTAVLDEHSRLRVLLTLRGDFVEPALLDVDFGELLRQRSDLVLPLTPEELERAITRPAQRLGLALEDGLVATMIGDVGAQPGALPMLQHTLRELFGRRSGHVLTRGAYVELGGVSGALAASAEAVFQQLLPADQDAARQLLLRLVTPGLGVPDTRRRARRAELAAVIGVGPLEQLSERLSRVRLLTFDHDLASREATVEVAHETLLRAWPRLRDWIEENREAMLTERRLALAAAEWARSGCEPSFLASGARLEQFSTFADGQQIALSADEQTYLAASVALRAEAITEEEARRQRELAQAQALAEEQARRAVEAQAAAATQRRAVTRLRGVVIGLGMALLVAGALLAFSLQQRAAAITAREAAAQAAAVATSRELASAAVNNLAVDAERSILLALRGLERAETPQAVEALHHAVLASRVERALPVPPVMVEDTAYSPDGAQLATADAQGTITVWDPAHGERLHTLSGHAVAYSPDGRTLGTIARDDTIVLYDATSGAPIRTLGSHPGAWTIRFSPDGSRVATGGDDTVVQLWAVDQDQPPLRLNGHTATVSGLGFAPDGARLASVDYDGALIIWDTRDGAQRLSVASGDVLSGASFSPDGSRITSGGTGGTVYIWDSETGESLLAVGMHSNHIAGARFSADGTSVMTYSFDGTAKLWDTASGNVLLTLSHNSPINAATLRADNARLVTGSNDGSVKIWDITPIGSHEVLSLPHRAIVWRVDYSADGVLLATSSWDGWVHVYDAQTGAPRWTKKLYAGRAMDVRFSPDGTQLISTGADSLVHILAAGDGRELRTLRGHGDGLLAGIFVGTIAAGFSPDGRLIASTGADGTARLWDAASGALLWNVKVGSGVTNVAFSPDGTSLATTTDLGALIEWDVQSGEQQRVYMEGGDENLRLWALTYSPDGRWLAAGGFGGAATVWDTATGGERLTLPGLTDTVHSLSYSADGLTLLTGSGEGVRLYDASTGALLLGLGAVEAMRDTTFRPGSTHLAAAGSKGLVRVITRDLAELREIARSRLTRELREEECMQYLHLASCPTAPQRSAASGGGF